MSPVCGEVVYRVPLSWIWWLASSQSLLCFSSCPHLFVFGVRAADFCNRPSPICLWMSVSSTRADHPRKDRAWSSTGHPFDWRSSWWPAGRQGELPPAGVLPTLMDRPRAGLPNIVASHRPMICRWPAQLSTQGFCPIVLQSCRPPGDRGKDSLGAALPASCRSATACSSSDW